MSFYDRKGRPISLEDWARLKSSASYSRVSADHVVSESGKEFEVLTSWVGSKGVIFETWISPADRGYMDTARHENLSQAMRRHGRIVTCLRLDQNPWDYIS